MCISQEPPKQGAAVLRKNDPPEDFTSLAKPSLAKPLSESAPDELRELDPEVSFNLT